MDRSFSVLEAKHAFWSSISSVLTIKSATTLYIIAWHVFMINELTSIMSELRYNLVIVPFCFSWKQEPLWILAIKRHVNQVSLIKFSSYRKHKLFF